MFMLKHSWNWFESRKTHKLLYLNFYGNMIQYPLWSFDLIASLSKSRTMSLFVTELRYEICWLEKSPQTRDQGPTPKALESIIEWVDPHKMLSKTFFETFSSFDFGSKSIALVDLHSFSKFIGVGAQHKTHVIIDLHTLHQSPTHQKSIGAGAQH